jgi:hypothetical protein
LRQITVTPGAATGTERSRAFVVDVDSGKRAGIDILGKGQARMHANLAAEQEACIGFTNDPYCCPLGCIRARAIADCRRTGRKGQETTAIGDQLAISGGIADLFRR